MMYSLLFLGLAIIPAANAWGRLGHETIAYIAQNFVEDSTREWTQNILGDTSEAYLARNATFADQYRNTTEGRFTSRFHYINLKDDPPTSCGGDFEAACDPKGCIISAIAAYTEKARNRGIVPIPPHEVSLALTLLIHFLGDITQPAHIESYGRGLNEIDAYFQHRKSNMHSIWDTEMPQELRDVDHPTLEDAKAWADDLTYEIVKGSYWNKKAEWIADLNIDDAFGSAIKFANDSNALICTVVMPDGPDALRDQEMFPEYYNEVIDTVQLQIAKGGYRLAKWLDALAPGSDDDEGSEELTVQSHRDLRKRM